GGRGAGTPPPRAGRGTDPATGRPTPRPPVPARRGRESSAARGLPVHPSSAESSRVGGPRVRRPTRQFNAPVGAGGFSFSPRRPAGSGSPTIIGRNRAGGKEMASRRARPGGFGR